MYAYIKIDTYNIANYILTPDKRFNPLKYETSDVKSSWRKIKS